ncbi:transcriptional regulator [Methanosarcinaceae archaeon]|nr:transcriptional regulator [Methanosarcinaceae archaeon]
MTKEVLIDQIIEILRMAGFSVSDRCNIRPRSFDIAARRDDTLLLCKVLFNIDGINEETAKEMRVLAAYLNGVPIVIGAKTRDQLLEDNVVYMRYNVVAISLRTLYDYFVEDIPTLISAAPGGLYVSIDGGALREARLSHDMSLGALASVVGVSRRTISKYEEDGMDASIDIVLSLEEIFNVELAKPIDILQPIPIDLLMSSGPKNKKRESKLPEPAAGASLSSGVLSSGALPPGALSSGTLPSGIRKNTVQADLSGPSVSLPAEKYPVPAPLVPAVTDISGKADDDIMLGYISTLGYDVRETGQAPFKAISKDSRSVILTGVSQYNPTTVRRAKLMSSISEVAGTESIFLIDGPAKVKSVDSTVLIPRKELEKIGGRDELIDMIEERKVPVKERKE